MNSCTSSYSIWFCFILSFLNCCCRYYYLAIQCACSNRCSIHCHYSSRYFCNFQNLVHRSLYSWQFLHYLMGSLLYWHYLLFPEDKVKSLQLPYMHYLDCYLANKNLMYYKLLYYYLEILLMARLSSFVFKKCEDYLKWHCYSDYV